MTARKKIEILGVNINPSAKGALLGEIEEIATGRNPGYIATVNPEFIVAAQKNEEFRDVLAKSVFNTADGIGIVWAAKFLSLRTSQVPVYRHIQVVAQWLMTLGATLVTPKWLHSIVKQRAPGTELFWDIAKIAEKHGLSIFLIGGFGDTPKITSKKLQEKYPRLKIAGTSTRNFDDKTAPSVVAKARPDIVYVAFGAVRQEKWMAEHQRTIGAKLMIGLGGTFDYVAGVQPEPPRQVRALGLEWLYRLITQPKRWKRIFTATVVFPWKVLACKIVSRTTVL